MGDLFNLQDEITKKIVVSLQVELTSDEDLRVFSKSTENLEAWKHYIKGIELFRDFNKENNLKAREYLEAALEFDPKFVSAMGLLASTHRMDAVLGWSDSPFTSFKCAFECAQKAMELDEQEPFSHVVLGFIYLFQRQHEKAISEGKRAITLNPNFDMGYAMLGFTMFYSGQFEEAITLMKKAFRINPNAEPIYIQVLVHSYIFLGRYEEALEIMNQIKENPLRGNGMAKFGPLATFSWIYQKLGREEEACAYMTEALKIIPDMSLEAIKMGNPFKNPAHLQRMLDAYQKSGMPEESGG